MSTDELSTRPAKKIKLQVPSGPSSFFTKTSEKPKSDLQWHVTGEKKTLLKATYRHSEVQAAVHGLTQSGSGLKLAAFDLDGTLIKCKSRNKFPTDETDWMFWDPTVPGKLRELSQSGHLVVIFSNQAGFKLTDSAKRYIQFQAKIRAITETLNIPLLLYAATGHDEYRKPRFGMFQRCKDDLQEYSSDAQPVDIDYTESTFVGDAAGRPSKLEGLPKSADFNSSDRKFAINAHLSFFTPEEYFQGKATERFEITGFDPVAFENPEKTDHLFARHAPLELVLFVGSPASGKSTYYKTFLEPLGYVRVNQDLLKSRNACLARAREILKDGQSVCIDNTNARRDTRALWLELAKEMAQEGASPVPVRVVQFTAETQLCKHNNALRAFSQQAHEKEKREILPDAAFGSFESGYSTPKLEEGFSRVDTVDFVLRGSREEQMTWRRYWT